MDRSINNRYTGRQSNRFIGMLTAVLPRVGVMFDSLVIETVTGGSPASFVVVAVVLAFLLAIVIAYTYVHTFQGLSYSQNFVQAMILSPIVTAIAMQAIGNSLAHGLGMMGAFSILRFRSNLKDPKDMFFLFAALAIGICCGVGNFSVAIIGTCTFCGAVVLLYYNPFVSSNRFDGMIRFNLEKSNVADSQLNKTLSDYCRRFSLVTIKDLAQGNRLDFAYHFKLFDNKTQTEFVDALKQIQDIRGIYLMAQESAVEI